MTSVTSGSESVAPDRLRRVPAFAAVSDSGVEALARGARERSYTSGTTIWRQGARAAELYVLMSGTVRAVCAGGGRETVVHRARAGDTLGEIPLFDGGRYPASLVAETPVRMLLVPQTSVMRAMAVDAGLAGTFLKALGRRVRELAARLESRAADPVRARLARWIVLCAESSSRDDFGLGMTQAALAQDLGTVREVVARHLGAWVRSGLLERRGRARYAVADRARLDAMAAGG